MNILHVIPTFNPEHPFGGSQSYVDMITAQLSNRKHIVTIYTSDMQGTAQKLKAPCDMDKERRVVRCRNLSTRLTRYTRLIVTPHLVPLLEATADRFEVIHVHGGRGFQHVAVWYAARRACVPYIIQPHGDFADYYSGMFRRFYDRFFGTQILRGAGRIVALNSFEASQCVQHGVQKRKIRIVPNGINLQEFTGLKKGRFRHKVGIDTNTKILLFLGRIHPVKGLDILLKSLFVVRKARNDVILVVAGPDDGDLARCSRLAQTLGLEANVRFIGPIFGREKLDALADADLYVLPSRYETFSIGLLEAYASGTAVVATAVGGNQELIVDGATGVLATKPDYHMFADALLRAIPKSETMGKKARSYVHRFDIAETAGILESVYLELG